MIICSNCWKKNYQPRILAQVYLRNKEKINACPNKQKLKDFISTRSVLQDTLKGVSGWNENYVISSDWNEKWVISTLKTYENILH